MPSHSTCNTMLTSDFDKMLDQVYVMNVHYAMKVSHASKIMYNE